MPQQRKSLQSQGVPIPDKLSAGKARRSSQRVRMTTRRRTPISGEMGGTQDQTVTTEDYYSASNRRRRGSITPRSAKSTVTSVGMLMAEFLFALGLLVLLMFANSSATFGDRIMSTMKRGALICALFFILALVSATGQGAAKIAKGFGALIIVAILLTSPVNTVVSDVDSIIKSDWKSTGEHGTDTSPSADTGTQAGASGILQQIEQNFGILGGGQSAGNPITNAIKSVLGGIIPGLGNLIP